LRGAHFIALFDPPDQGGLRLRFRHSQLKSIRRVDFCRCASPFGKFVWISLALNHSLPKIDP